MTCTQYAFKNVNKKYSPIASQFVPYSLPKTCWVVLYTTRLKRSMFYWFKSFYLKSIKNIGISCEGPIKEAH